MSNGISEKFVGNVGTLICPNCKKVPIAEVVQCKNGHSLCIECFRKIVMDYPSECPNCNTRLYYGVTRNHCMEAILDGIKLNCANKDAGCTKKLNRREVKDHSVVCRFSPDNRMMCSETGMPECSQLSNAGDIPNFLRHLEQNHNFVMLEIEGLLTQPTYLSNFLVGPPPEFSFQRSEGYMRPVVVKNFGRNFALVIIPTLIPPGDTVSFNAVYVEEKQPALHSKLDVQYKLEYTFCKNPREANEENDLKITMLVASLSKGKRLFEEHPIRLSVNLLKQNYINTQASCISLLVKLVQVNPKTIFYSVVSDLEDDSRNERPISPTGIFRTILRTNQILPIIGEPVTREEIVRTEYPLPAAVNLDDDERVA